MIETTEVLNSYLAKLELESKILNALYAGGVDNWEWYSESLREAGLFDDEEEDDD